MEFLAKIAVDLKDAVAERAAGGAGSPPPEFRTVAHGPGWSVDDVTCTYGPHDRPFSEEHSGFSVALVLAGTFQYRGLCGRERTGHLMTPGSLMLGNPGQPFECVHQHGHGDRCLSFHFAPEYFEEIAADAGAPRGRRGFRPMSLPAMREMSPLAAKACANLAGTSGAANLEMPWGEIAMQVGAAAIRSANEFSIPEAEPLPSAAARITRAVRMMEENHQQPWTLQRLASEAGLSPYHFLRTFEMVTGVTPHQYARRVRLRRAATQFLAESSSILDIVMDCGFGDLSNFNRAFRDEFGMSPREFRRDAGLARRPGSQTPVLARNF